MIDTYKTVKGSAEGLYKDKGSKFISFINHVESEAEIKAHLEEIRKKYFDARHHCYAYILGPEGKDYRANDDGEPSGTAGRPIHGQLVSFGLTNTLIIVVRYFGGILLGTSGLITAYKEAARDAIQNATIVEKTINDTFEVHFDYPRMNDVMRVLKEYQISPGALQCGSDCQLEISIRKSLSERCSTQLRKIYGVEINKIS